MSAVKWDWAYVRQELDAAFNGEVAPGVYFEVSGGDSLAVDCRVVLRVRDTRYTYGFLSTCGKKSTGYVGVHVDDDMALEIGWPMDGALSFVVDREELRGLCADIRNSESLNRLVRRLAGEETEMELKIGKLLQNLGSKESAVNVRTVRKFLEENCLEVANFS